MPRPRKPTQVELPRYVNAVRAKGRIYYYCQPFRGTRDAKKPVRLPDDPGSPEFWAAYRRVTGEPEPRESPNSFVALVRAYQQAPEWAALSDTSRREYARYHKLILASWGKLEVAGLEPRHVLALRDKYRQTPATANYLIRVLSALLSWSIPRGFRKDNPCAHVPKLSIGDGWAAWSWEQIEHLHARAVPEMWVAAALGLYTGQRQGDVLAMNWSAVDKGAIEVVQSKTKKRVWVPVHRDLRAVLEATPRRGIKILTTRDGAPWTTDGFKTQWARQMECISLLGGELDGLVYHGLRKSAVCFLLEAGCSVPEVAAISGQSMQMIEHYSSMVNRRKLAASAILRWESSGADAENT